MSPKPYIKREPSTTSSSIPSTSNKPSPSTPTGSYTDFILRSAPSSSQTGWKFNVMKFAPAGNKTVDLLDEGEFVRPLRLNRRDPRTVRRLTEMEREKIRRKAMGLNEDAKDEDEKKDGVDDNKDGEDGEAKESLNPELVGTGVGGKVAPQQRKKKNGRFEKKIKRVFVSSEEARRLRREEWQPWLLEDDEGNERWVGRLEGGAGERSLAIEQEKSRQELERKGNATMAGWRPASEGSATGGGGSNYVAFVFGPDGDEFQVIPINRWYKFSQGPKYMTLGNDEAELEYERQQKSHEAERWVMHRRTTAGQSSAGANASAGSSGSSTPRIPLGDDGGLPALPPDQDIKPRVNREGSNDPASNSIRSRLMNKSESSARRVSGQIVGRPKLKSVDTGPRAENDDDELYGKKRGDDNRGQDQDDDEFDYDEEFQDDEEGIAKIDDLADEQETKELEERIRKEMRAVERAPSEPEDEDDLIELTATGKDLKRLVKRQDNDGIYASDDDEESSSSSDDDDTKSVTSNGGAGGQDIERSGSGSQKPSSSSTNKLRQDPSNRSGSASRAHSNQASRHPSRAASPSGSALIAKRATSPTRSNPNSRASSPVPGGSGSGKRKRDNEEGSSKRRALSPSHSNSSWDAPPETLIKDQNLIDYFKSRPENKTTTKDVLGYFKRQLKGNDKNKDAIKAALHNVASMSEKFLVLKNGL